MSVKPMDVYQVVLHIFAAIGLVGTVAAIVIAILFYWGMSGFSNG